MQGKRPVRRCREGSPLLPPYSQGSRTDHNEYCGQPVELVHSHGGPEQGMGRVFQSRKEGWKSLLETGHTRPRTLCSRTHEPM